MTDTDLFTCSPGATGHDLPEPDHQGNAATGGAPGRRNAGGELAALVDGPWVGCWYRRTDLEAQQRAARDTHARGGTARLGTKAHYVPTEAWRANPVTGEPGRVWHYQPPPAPTGQRNREDRPMTTTAKAASSPARPDRLLEVALAAAARGWHVFPLRPGTKFPALHGHDRCPRTGVCAEGHLGWEQRATTDPDRIRAAWSGTPYNVGIACGPSGLVVIDLDVPKPDDDPPPDWVAAEPGVRDGQDVLAVVAERASQPVPGDTYSVTTASGGVHLYYLAPAGTALRNTAGERGHGLGWKIDTRAHGGMVLAAGSVLPAKGTYRVLAERDPAPLPGWLVERLTPPPVPTVPSAPVALTGKGDRARYLAAAINGETAKVAAATANRNTALYLAALALGQLVAGGELTEAEVTTALLSAAARHVALGVYSQRQAHSTIASGLRAGANRPRQVAA